MVGNKTDNLMLVSALRRGFALPTVLISSIVLMIVLTIAVSATTAVRENLLTQYYTQVAQVAGEAGVAYAKACLAANSNVPTWNNSQPLTPQTDCTGTVVPGYPQYLYSSSSMRSSFSVGLPTTDANGQAVTIPNSGYVQLLRTTTGAVWRTYTQPTSQPAVVPDLCSGAATTDQGWNSAVVTTPSSSNLIAGALTIGLSAASTQNVGPNYYRKDFTINQAGSYTIQVRADDTATVYIDGLPIGTTVNSGDVVVLNTTLTAGCHIMNVTVTNTGLAPSASNLSLSMAASSSSTAIMTTDTTWRVAAGNTTHYSQIGYYEDPSVWSEARVYGVPANTSTPWTGSPSTWSNITTDVTAEWITNAYGASGNNYPSAKYTYFRSTQGFTLAATTSLRITSYCDNTCAIYVDGTLVDTSQYADGVHVTTVTLVAGKHNVGIRLYNSSLSTSGFVLNVVDPITSSVYLRSDDSWDAAAVWESTAGDYSSYDATYYPYPTPTKTVNAQLLLVGGGGAGGAGYEGGGGGAGGVVYDAAHRMIPGSYTITVGSGGAADANVMNNGSDSTFVLNTANSSTTDALRAYGGGSGNAQPAGSTHIYAKSGGSGGGAAYNYINVIPPGVIGQGNRGGAGYGSNPYIGGGGGGACQTTTTCGIGGDATSANAGAGGTGIANPISGSTTGELSGGIYYLAGGGGGSRRSGAVGTNGAGGLGGGGAGNGLGAGTAGMANTGGGGGAGGSNAAILNGAGGSGVVIIVLPTSTVVSLSGSGSYTTTTSGANTIYTFTSGTKIFTIVSI